MLNVLKSRMVDLHRKLASDTFLCNKELLNEATEVQFNIKNMLMDRTKSAMIQSRFQWYNEGEKNTKYFFNFEKMRFNAKTMECIVLDSGDLSYDPEMILNEQEAFYQ